MTEPRIERRLAAILAADVAGYSRLLVGLLIVVNSDQDRTLLFLRASSSWVQNRNRACIRPAETIVQTRRIP
jgi:hypothetical protein